MKNKNRLAVLASLLWVSLAPALAQADQLADIRKTGELVCGVLGTDEPESFVDPKTRKIIGYDVDLCAAMAHKIGVNPEVKQLSVAARIPELLQARVDILAASHAHPGTRSGHRLFHLLRSSRARESWCGVTAESRASRSLPGKES